MAHEILKLDGSVDFTWTDSEYSASQHSGSAGGIDEKGRTTIPNGDLVWMYAFTSSASSASLISELTTENGGTDAAHIRIANWDGLS